MSAMNEFRRFQFCRDGLMHHYPILILQVLLYLMISKATLELFGGVPFPGSRS
jgi:hypothetical protein